MINSGEHAYLYAEDDHGFALGGEEVAMALEELRGADDAFSPAASTGELAPVLDDDKVASEYGRAHGIDGDCGSSFIPQLAPNNRSQWEQAFSSDLQLPSRITDPPPCFNESSPSELAALEEANEEAVVVLDGCLTGSLADVMSATIATSLVVSLSVSAVASTASSVVVSIVGSNVASTPVLAAGK